MPLLSSIAAHLATIPVFLAQVAEKAVEKAAPAPGAAPPVPVPGGEVAVPKEEQGGGGWGGMIMPLLLCLVVFYFLLIMPERRKQKTRMAMIKGVKKGDQVVTTAGIIGKVMKVEEREVVLQVDKDGDVRMRFLKSAIHEVILEGTEGKEGSAPLPDAEKK